ncbi:MAG: holo-ACP synthase [Eubacteriales bacterium]|nr:holo-ACP synthase [Eubacteriales bacterium]
MRFSIGNDIVSIERFAEKLERGAARLLPRLFTERELLAGEGQNAAYWAVRFAAKEAMAKALGTGIMNEKLGFHDLEVCKLPSGAVEFSFSERASKLLTAGGWQGHKLSLSHDCFALATVLIWGADGET